MPEFVFRSIIEWECSPQGLGQANKDDAIGMHKFPQSTGWEPVGILVGPGCRLELFLGERLRVAQNSSRLVHHRRLDRKVRGGRSLIMDLECEPPFLVMPRERNIRRDPGGGKGNHFSGRRRTLRL